MTLLSHIHRIAPLVLILSSLAPGANPAWATDRGWEARDRLTSLGERGAFTSYVRTEHALVSQSFRVHYWRGPCMLYWSGEAGEGGMISMGNFRSAEVDGDGRLVLRGRGDPDYLALVPTLSRAERLQAADAMRTIISECRGPD
jgi:hypothetical protein